MSGPTLLGFTLLIIQANMANNNPQTLAKAPAIPPTCPAHPIQVKAGAKLLKGYIPYGKARYYTMTSNIGDSCRDITDQSVS